MSKIKFPPVAVAGTRSTTRVLTGLFTVRHVGSNAVVHGKDPEFLEDVQRCLEKSNGKRRRPSALAAVVVDVGNRCYVRRILNRAKTIGVGSL